MQELTDIYQCFADETRLRILHLLSASPLCVCHIQQVLQRPQVVVSQHLAYLRTRGLVRCERFRNYMIYSLPDRPSPALTANLECLWTCLQNLPVIQQDRAALSQILETMNLHRRVDESSCAIPVESPEPAVSPVRCLPPSVPECCDPAPRRRRRAR